MIGSLAGTGGVSDSMSRIGVKANLFGVRIVLAAGVIRSGNGGGSGPALATSFMST